MVTSCIKSRKVVVVNPKHILIGMENAMMKMLEYHLITKDGQNVQKLVTTSPEFIATLALTGFTISANFAVVKCSLQVRNTEVFILNLLKNYACQYRNNYNLTSVIWHLASQISQNYARCLMELKVQKQIYKKKILIKLNVYNVSCGRMISRPRAYSSFAQTDFHVLWSSLYELYG